MVAQFNSRVLIRFRRWLTEPRKWIKRKIIISILKMTRFCNRSIRIVENKTKIFHRRSSSLNMTTSFKSLKKVGRRKVPSRYTSAKNRGHYHHRRKVHIFKLKHFLATISHHETSTKSLAKSKFTILELSSWAKASKLLRKLLSATIASTKTSSWSIWRRKTKNSWSSSKKI